jgi:S1-C subfamily serine protease
MAWDWRNTARIALFILALSANARADTPPPAPADASALRSEGTAFYIAGESGSLVTAAHAVRNCARVYIKRPQGPLIPVAVARIDGATDLALLHDGTRPAGIGLPVSQQAQPLLGEAVMLYGFPLLAVLQGQGTLLVGVISGFGGTRLGSTQFDPDLLRISMNLKLGFSGAALVDQTGGVVGVASSVEFFGSLGANPPTSSTVLNFVTSSVSFRGFLDTAKVSYKKAADAGQRSTPDIAATLQKASVVVFCGP